MDSETAMVVQKLFDSYIKSGDSLISLWNFYMAASFAAAGFSLSKEIPTLPARKLIAIGYSTFLAGHAALLKNAISLKVDLSCQIKGYLIAPIEPASYLKAAISTCDDNVLLQSLGFHVVIDTCVILLIIYSEKFRRLKEQA